MNYRYLTIDDIKEKVEGCAGVVPAGITLDGDVLIVSFAVPLDANQRAALDEFLATRGFVSTADNAVVLRDPRYEVQTVASGQVAKIEWFEQDTGNGTFADLARRDVNAWQGSKLLSTQTTLYYTDGSAGPTWTDTYATSGTKRIRRRT